MIPLVPGCTGDSKKLTDHRMRSGLRVVDTISVGKMSFWSKLTYIFQSPDGSRREVFALGNVLGGCSSALRKRMVSGSP